MGKIIIGMTMSVDGYISDQDGSLGKLYPDFNTPEFKNFVAETAPEVGAVIMGMRTFEMAGDPDSYAHDYEYQVPLFIVTKNPPAKHPKENEKLTITFVNNIPDAIAAAKKAAGDKNVVVVGGASVEQQLLNAKLADELHVDIIPVILGGGTKFFDNIDREIQLEKIKLMEVGERIVMQFKVIKE